MSVVGLRGVVWCLCVCVCVQIGFERTLLFRVRNWAFSFDDPAIVCLFRMLRLANLWAPALLGLWVASATQAVQMGGN